MPGLCGSGWEVLCEDLFVEKNDPSDTEASYVPRESQQQSVPATVVFPTIT